MLLCNDMLNMHFMPKDSNCCSEFIMVQSTETRVQGCIWDFNQGFNIISIIENSPTKPKEVYCTSVTSFTKANLNFDFLS